MKSGTKPTRIDHRDYDYHASFGSVAPLTFPVSYLTDAGLWMPNQDAPDPTFNNPALYSGCTDITQADLCNDIVGKLAYNPIMIEDIDHANALGGVDVRTSLKVLLQLKWIAGFFNIQPYQLDFFGSIQLAMISGIPEKRSVSIGTPWFPEFEGIGLNTPNHKGQTISDGILHEPTSYVLDGQETWHNYKICGWKQINGQTYLISKSWQGVNYGDKGFVYMSRSLVNNLMKISGSCAFTVTQGKYDPTTISVCLWQWLISNFHNLLGLRY